MGAFSGQSGGNKNTVLMELSNDFRMRAMAQILYLIPSTVADGSFFDVIRLWQLSNLQSDLLWLN